MRYIKEQWLTQRAGCKIQQPRVGHWVLTLKLDSWSLVLKDNLDVLSRLPELIEQFLNKEPVNLDLAEARLTEENRYKYLTMLNHILMAKWKENLWFIFGELVYICEIADSIMTRGDRMLWKDRILSLHYTQGRWHGKVSRKEAKRLGKKVGIHGVRRRRKD